MACRPQPGADAEKDLVDRLPGRSSGIPVVATCAAAVQTLRRLGAGRITVVDPPWFDKELNRLGAEYFSAQGFEVVFHAPCGLPSNQRRINPPEVDDWILAHTPDSAQAVFVGGNGFRSVGDIAALEEDLARPVLTANQVLLWGMLQAIRSRIFASWVRAVRPGSVPGMGGANVRSVRDGRVVGHETFDCSPFD